MEASPDEDPTLSDQATIPGPEPVPALPEALASLYARPGFKLRRAPLRLATGAFILSSGLDKRGGDEETAFTFTEWEGVSTFVWIDGGFQFAIAAELDRDRLLPIATRVYERLA